VGLLANLLNTNDLTTQFSINNPNPNAWATQLDGFNVLSNTLSDFLAYRGNGPFPLPFNTVTVSSNSPQATLLAKAIVNARAAQPNQLFHNLGDLLAIPSLSQQSPYLNTDTNQLYYGLNDAAYESIPSQLLPLLRADSIGGLTATYNQRQLQFSGYDGHYYAVQVSSDLLNWISLATNSPVNGTFSLPLPPQGNATAQFFRSVLVQ
jgi:hypothetical protein